MQCANCRNLTNIVMKCCRTPHCSACITASISVEHACDLCKTHVMYNLPFIVNLPDYPTEEDIYAELAVLFCAPPSPSHTMKRQRTMLEPPELLYNPASPAYLPTSPPFSPTSLPDLRSVSDASTVIPDDLAT